MAGGTATRIDTPYPKGEDSLIVLEFPFTIVASKSADFIAFTRRAEFAFKPISAWTTAQEVAVTNAITINLVDDSSTPKEIITDQTLAAVTAGAGSHITVALASGAKAQQINAGALLEMSYASGASDTSLDSMLFLLVRPVF